jgi:hypothetical protein
MADSGSDGAPAGFLRSKALASGGGDLVEAGAPKFKPAVKDGKPVPVYGIIEVYYHLPGGCPSQTPAENSK